MKRVTRIALTVLLATASCFYIAFIVPIWVLGQGLADAPIFELRGPALPVEIAGIFLIGLWFLLVRWLRKSPVQP